MPRTRFSDTNIRQHLGPGEYTDPRYVNLRLRIGRSQKKGKVNRATWGLRLRRQADGSRPWMKLGYWPELNCEGAELTYKDETARIAPKISSSGSKSLSASSSQPSGLPAGWCSSAI